MDPLLNVLSDSKYSDCIQFVKVIFLFGANLMEISRRCHFLHLLVKPVYKSKCSELSSNFTWTRSRREGSLEQKPKVSCVCLKRRCSKCQMCGSESHTVLKLFGTSSSQHSRLGVNETNFLLSCKEALHH